MSSVRDNIIESAARTLWVCAYMNHVEDFQEHKGDVPKRSWRRFFCPAEFGGACVEFGTHDRPSAGENWMDFAPPTGEAAREKARKLIVEIEKRSKVKVDARFVAIFLEYTNEMQATGKSAHLKKPTAEDFGHYLAMEALGHGVSWADDHPDHGLKLPLIEFGAWDI